MKRRNFIKYTGLVTTASLVPNFLSAGTSLLTNQSYNGKKLVVIQLSGGNDGLNTFVPYRNDIYYRLRPRLAIQKDQVLALTDDYGLNNKLAGLKSLYDDGLVSVINNVGYPNPNRSHFRSMDIWQTGSSSEQFLQTGWLGRFLDSSCSGHCEAHRALEVSDTLSLALKGDAKKGIASQDIKQMFRSSKDAFVKAVQTNHSHHEEHEDVAYLHKVLAETTSSAKYLHEKSKIYTSKAAYPAGNKIAKKLKQVAELIISGSDTSVYYVDLSGFDTHAGQKGQQNRLLEQYGDAVKVFVNDLKKSNRLDETLVMTFSEFGRRVAQNASNGTDHGTANNVWFIGGKLKKQGLYNDLPDLSNLDKQGDIQYKVDFRSIYSTVLNKWLEVDARKVIHQPFKNMGFV